MPIALVLASLLQATTDFERLTLATEFLCEGASAADLDRDGDVDVVSGPYWYPGPDFAERRELYPPRAFDPVGYSDNFFAFPRDFDGDGWTDVLFVGFPGEAATWYANPRGETRPWTKHVVVAHVDGESPEWADLTGDGVPELVFLQGGKLGWAGPEAGAPEKPWTFHALSADLGAQRFTHGLGVGDLDGDGRADVLLKQGWWRQPESLAGDPEWEHVPCAFSQKHGGAQMLVSDVDHDGDADVISALAAHEFGLSWFAQVDGSKGRAFVEHRVMDDEPTDNAQGVRFGELHALALVDLDGDGDQDVVTGKRWWSHGAAGDPDGGAVPAVVYAFKNEPGADGKRTLVAELLDDGSGVGTQVVATDVSGDGRPDVVIGNKKGTFVLRRKGGKAPPVAPPSGEGVKPVLRDGRVPNLDFEDGSLRDWTAEGAAFAGQPVRGDTVSARGREAARLQGEFWLGGYELAGDGPTGTLTSLAFPVLHPWASFLVGGGGSEATRVELELVGADGTGRTLFRTSGANFESMQRVVVDLSAVLGRELRVRLVDEAAGGWGHLNFDDFRFHAARPSFPRVDGVPPILPPDPVLFAGLPAREAAAAMSVPEGFRVELVASEPDLHQPIALTVDPRGRLWVVEAHTYPQRAPEGEGRDQILVFTDADHDGRFETRTVFARGLNLVSGLEVGFGGAWVGAAPYLYFIPDRDDDLVPDGPPEVLLDGWGYQDTHETLNSFTWGPDGWLYGCHGVFTHSRVGKPGTSDERRVPLNAGVWRFHPTRHEFELFAEGTSNPWGLDFDAHGQAFVEACVIPHFFHLAQGGRYLRQAGAHFEPFTYEDIDTIADHRHYLGDDPHGGNLRSNAAGGGHAHCGLLCYRADAFPAEWRGRFLMGNIHGNRINADVPERAGSGFTGRHGPDFLLANDKWFRAISLKLAPEGSLYLIDWYDQQACHWTAPEIWDRTNGRLYRVSYGRHVPMQVDLTRLPSDELVRLLFHSNEWFARRARVLLAERGPDEEVTAILRRIVLEKGAPERALGALWALHVTSGVDERLTEQLLAAKDENLRAWAIQCALESRAPADALLDRLALLAMDEPSARVRLYLASALQRIPLDERFGLARALVAHAADADDPNVPYLLWYGIEPIAGAAPEQALVLARETKIPKLAHFLYRRLGSQEATRPALVRALAEEEEPATRTRMLDELVTAVAAERGLAAPRGWSELYPRLARDADGHVRAQALELALAFGDASAFPELRALADDARLAPERRVRALEALVRGRDAGAGEVLVRALATPELVTSALRGLAAIPHPAAAGAVLARYPTLDPGTRREAVATLAARAESAKELLRAVGAGVVAKSELSAFELRRLRQLDDPELARLLEEHVGQVLVADASKEAELARVRARLEGAGTGDLALGRAVFARTCQQCHTLFGEGGALGPELTGSNRADREYLLANVVDPSGVVTNEYRTTVARTLDGRLVTGIERGRTTTSVTLATETETVTLALEDLAELELSPLSTMPEGQLDPLSDAEIAGLFAYLASPRQTPQRATKLDVPLFFDRKSLARWHGDPAVWSVEDGEIVGKTAGLARNEFLKSAFELGDFRLSLEVRLVGDAGNSGIQFRSSEVEGGDVQGYQADIGPGWWGKLYEEHGRELLVETGATSVRPDGWNRYVIECRGPRVRTWLNDEPCVDLDDPAGAPRGIVALQVHSGGATEVRFRNLVLELLDP